MLLSEGPILSLIDTSRPTPELLIECLATRCYTELHQAQPIVYGAMQIHLLTITRIQIARIVHKIVYWASCCAPTAPLINSSITINCVSVSILFN
jgi:hypothetical protein